MSRYYGKASVITTRPMSGITRRVVQELPRAAGDRRYRYLLECGHVVHRNMRGEEWCYCAACLMAGDG